VASTPRRVLACLSLFIHLQRAFAGKAVWAAIGLDPGEYTLELELEDALIHAVLCADTRKQMAMCGVFYKEK
jgi:hypothetical protein